jgi:hypothetical protein
MINKLEILSPNATYHIYNRANGSASSFNAKKIKLNIIGKIIE